MLRSDDESRSVERFALLVDALTVTTEFYRPERNQRLSLREIRYFGSTMVIAARAFRNGSRNSIIRILGKTGRDENERDAELNGKNTAGRKIKAPRMRA